MNRYIALLRGINVGGNNKLSMVDLKKEFEELGFKDVFTYINSGNIIFSTRIDEAELQRKCELMIKNRFNLNITVLILSAKDLSHSLANAPIWWGLDKESKHNAIFVIPPVTAEEIINQVGLTDLKYERVAFCGQIIFWSAPLKTFSRTRLSRLYSSITNSVTVRNANTAKKILQIVEDCS